MKVAVSLLLFLSSLSAAGPEELANAGHFLRLKALVEPLVKADPNDAESAYWLSQAEGSLSNRITPDTTLRLRQHAAGSLRLLGC